jgi:tripartite-type tricarboxylate transporter receptor subunit TctC
MLPVLRFATLLASLFVASVCHAQNSASGYPDRPVKLLVPFAPGGIADVMARLLAQKMSERLGKQFFVDNRAGAGANIGTGVAATSPADGYTILITTSAYVVNPSLYAKIPYDPNRDLIPITIAATSPNLLAVHPSVPAKTVQELIDYVRKNPGKASFATAGIGTTPHLAGEMFRLSLGLDMVHVPFGGAGPALQSTVAGHTPMAFIALPPAIALVQAGELRGLAVTSAKRAPTLPDVPTLAETGINNQESETILLIMAPAATPKEIVDLLYREISSVTALPDVKENLARLGFDPLMSAPEQSAVRVKEEIARWGKVIADAKIERQ